MFFLLLTVMIISFVVGTTFIVKGGITIGLIAIGVGIIFLLFTLFYYGKKKYRKKKYDCTPDCVPDFDPDCDCMPDCDCGPDCG